MEDTGKIRVVVTHGDMNGTGYETLLRTLAQPEMMELCVPIVYGAEQAARYYIDALQIQVGLSVIPSAGEAEAGVINLVDVVGGETLDIQPGEASPDALRAALRAIDRAAIDWKDGLYDTLVTAPIGDVLFALPAAPAPSETRYIAESMDSHDTLDIYVSGSLRVAAIGNESTPLDVDHIAERIGMLARALRRDFRISGPRIGVMGGAAWEQETLRKAVAKAFDGGVLAFGPYAPQALAHEGSMDARLDAIMTVREADAARLIDSRAACPAIRFTAGLPVPRTQPLGGAGYDRAGRGEADEANMRQAIYTAIDAARQRRQYDRDYHNPLPKLYHERREEGDKARFAAPRGVKS